MAAIRRKRIAKVFGPDFTEDNIREIYLAAL